MTTAARPSTANAYVPFRTAAAPLPFAVPTSAAARPVSARPPTASPAFYTPPSSIALDKGSSFAHPVTTNPGDDYTLAPRTRLARIAKLRAEQAHASRPRVWGADAAPGAQPPFPVPSIAVTAAMTGGGGVQAQGTDPVAAAWYGVVEARKRRERDVLTRGKDLTWAERVALENERRQAEQDRLFREQNFDFRIAKDDAKPQGSPRRNARSSNNAADDVNMSATTASSNTTVAPPATGSAAALSAAASSALKLAASGLPLEAESLAVDSIQRAFSDPDELQDFLERRNANEAAYKRLLAQRGAAGMGGVFALTGSNNTKEASSDDVRDIWQFVAVMEDVDMHIFTYLFCFSFCMVHITLLNFMTLL